MNYMLEHPAVFFGLCGVLVCNAVIIWRHQQRNAGGDVIPFERRSDPSRTSEDVK
jgi:hypothetical protein